MSLRTSSTSMMMLYNLEGAAANGVSLVFVLLVPRSERKLVDEIERHRHLALAHAAAVPVVLVCLADPPDVVLQPTCTHASHYLDVDQSYELADTHSI